MPTNYTPNYRLNQWERSDKVLMDDFNADNAKVDAALGALAAADTAEAQARKSLEAQVAKRGNCRIWFKTYTGTGTMGASNANQITFPGPPVLAIVACSGGPVMWLTPGCTSSGVLGLHSAGVSETVSWNGNSVSWYVTSGTAEHQLNGSGRQYFVYAFLQADA